MAVRWGKVVAVVVLLSSTLRADWKDDIGYASLKARLGTATPQGAGIAVSHIEAKSGGNYLVDTSLSEFIGKTITAMSGSTGISSHATTVAKYNYGSLTSIAPAVNTIDLYEAGSWLSTVLKLGTVNQQPVTESRRTQNHSWISTTLGSDATDTEALRRIDLVVKRDGVVVVVAVNNGAGTAMPRILCSAYNVLTIGLTSGGSSYGPTPTGIDGSGRVKPDLVIPQTLTSWASPIAASSAALLLETEDANNILPVLSASARKTAKALLTKTLLMAGATKTECAGWRKGFAAPSTNGTVPLDYRYGAGELNIDNSHRILASGQQSASGSSLVTTTGWDFGTAGTSGGKQYFVDIPSHKRISQLSILTSWNRTVSNPPGLTPTLANIDLKLYRASGFTKGVQVDASVSAIDNVEHIYLTNRSGGRYVFEVTTNQSWDYAIAWDVVISPHVSPDLNSDGHVDSTDFDTFSACYNGPTNYVTGDCLLADFNGDQHVDSGDFDVFSGCYNGPVNLPSCP